MGKTLYMFKTQPHIGKGICSYLIKVIRYGIPDISVHYTTKRNYLESLFYHLRERKKVKSILDFVTKYRTTDVSTFYWFPKEDREIRIKLMQEYIDYLKAKDALILWEMILAEMGNDPTYSMDTLLKPMRENMARDQEDWLLVVKALLIMIIIWLLH